MLLADCILVAGGGYIDSRLVKFLSRERALIKEQLAALEYLFLRIQRLLRLLRIGFGLLDLLRQTGSCRCLIRGLSLIVGTFGVLRCRTQVAVFKHGQQFSRANW